MRGSDVGITVEQGNESIAVCLEGAIDIASAGCMSVGAEIVLSPTRSHSASWNFYGLLGERDREDALAEDQTDRLFEQDVVEDR